ncbi:hypothetical protein TEK04_17245 [Klenkia sp. LSe6-5]|uniref:GGDEF domain-containing protein, diguanylate cyclase (C-di-GMP synthetase) or its enzymatically inactive variants n=1 Tax=Klenkia sesuvii TaxID=3103137 RepID=A0ABU8DXA2_9ACTN
MAPVHGVGRAAAFAAAAEDVVDDLAAGHGYEAAVVSRMTDRTWTGLAARSGGRATSVGRVLPVEHTACHHLLVDHWPVVERDLHQHADPALRSVAERYGVSAYGGAALLGPDGRRLGSVYGYSSDARDDVDADRFATRLAVAAADLGRRLTSALEAAADERRAAHDRARASADGVTGLPDRRGWGLFLQEEGVRAGRLGEDMSVVLLDVGLVRTVRGVRRAGDVLREALGDLGVSRVSGRQFGVVAGGPGDADPAEVAATAQAALRAAGYTATSGWALRDPLEGAVGTWWRAEDALLRVRAATAAG